MTAFVRHAAALAFTTLASVTLLVAAVGPQGLTAAGPAVAHAAPYLA